MVSDFIKVCEGKIKQKDSVTFLLAILAGMFIAFGASSSSLAVAGVENYGLSKTIAGTIFPVGLMLIVVVGGELFTGDCMLVFGNMDRRYSVLKTLRKLCIVYLGNAAGAVLLMLLIYKAGQYDMASAQVGAYTIKVAYGKLQLSFGQAVASGILCNILVCAAVLMAAKAATTAGKIVAVFFPIFAFVIGSFEHCVANMYYIPAGIMAASNPELAQKATEVYGLTGEMLGQLSVGNMLLHNLLPVTIGNMIGGMVMVALPLYVIEKASCRNA